MLFFVRFLATGCGLGRVQFMPGTFGTLGGLALAWLVSGWTPIGSILFALGLVGFSILIAELYERSSATHDAKEIVIDEWAGMVITLTLVPWTWATALAGFLLFRILDILKPFPISHIDKKIHGGLGVVLDDVAAGVLANVLLHFAVGRFLE